MSKLIKRANRYYKELNVTDGRTDPNQRKALKKTMIDDLIH